MFVLGLSFAVAVLDQVTKHLVRDAFHVGQGQGVIAGLFQLRYVQNTGAAWGMLSGLNGWLVALSIAMLIVIAVFRRSFMEDGRVQRVAAALMIAGIVGNLIDRIRLGYVVDFLDFFWRGRHFPAFNVADIAICTGVGLYMLSQFLPHAGAGGATRERPREAVPTIEQ